MASDDLDEGRNTALLSRWRWIDAARYVVALAMTALIVTVIGHAIYVLLRPDVLYVVVDKGFVAVEHGTPAGNLSFALDLEFANPSGRAVIYYEDIMAYLYGRANNKTAASFFVTIRFKEGISLKQDSTKFEYLHPYPDLNSVQDYKPYFDLFNSSGNKGILDGVVVVNGTLTVGLYWSNKTAITATYYCWPVAIGGYSSDDSAGGAQCSHDPPTQGASLT